MSDLLFGNQPVAVATKICLFISDHRNENQIIYSRGVTEFKYKLFFLTHGK